MKQRKSISEIAKERAAQAANKTESVPPSPVTPAEIDAVDAELKDAALAVRSRRVIRRPVTKNDSKSDEQTQLEFETSEPEVEDIDIPEISSGEFLADKLTMGKAFDTIIERITKIRPEEDHEEILAFLKLSERPSEASYGTQANALEMAQIIAHSALVLAANAKIALANFEAEADVIEATIHTQTTKFLDNQYKKGERSKPTVDVINSTMKTRYHDQWRRLEDRRAKAKQTVGVLEGLVRITAERAKDLRQLVASTRNT